MIWAVETCCFLLCHLRQCVHRQSRPQRLGNPAVAMQSPPWRTGCSKPSARPSIRNAKAMVFTCGGGRAPELAGRRSRVRHGAANHRQVARKKAAGLPPLSETLLQAEKGDVLELDELWSFVGSKLNPRWLWIALGRQTRQVVAYLVGDRSADSDHALRERMLPDDRCRATRSDLVVWRTRMSFTRRTASARVASERR